MGMTAKPRSLRALDKRAEPAQTSTQMHSVIDSPVCNLISFPGTVAEDWIDSPNAVESERFAGKVGVTSPVPAEDDEDELSRRAS